jgi:hypothetical protein
VVWNAQHSEYLIRTILIDSWRYKTQRGRKELMGEADLEASLIDLKMSEFDEPTGETSTGERSGLGPW